MSILDIARLVVYRFHEKGLEIFLVNSDLKHDPDIAQARFDVVHAGTIKQDVPLGWQVDPCQHEERG